MKINKINKKWFDNLFKSLFNDEANILNKLLEVKTQLKDTLLEKLSSKHDWSLIEFFVFAIAWNGVDELLANDKTRHPDNLDEASQNIRYKRPLINDDISELIEKLNIFYSEKLSMLKELNKNNGRIKSALLITWLELIEKAKNKFYIDRYTFKNRIITESEYHPSGTVIIELLPTNKVVDRLVPAGQANLITEELRKLILFDYFNIDLIKADNKRCDAEICNIEDASSILGLSVDQLLYSLCDQNFDEFGYLGVYIKNNFKLFTTNSSNYFDRQFIEEQRLQAPNYIYPYKNLIRIKRGSIFDELYKNSIEVHNNDNYRLIDLQPTLIDIIQNNSSNIELRGGQKITASHLVFIKEELYEFKNQKEQTNSINKVEDKSICATQKIVDSEIDFIKKNREDEKIFLFEKVGDFYNIEFKGKKVHLKSTYGLIYIEHLINNPDRDFTPNDLYILVNKSELIDLTKEQLQELFDENFDSENSKQEISDEDSIKAYNDRLSVIASLLLNLETGCPKYNDLCAEEKFIKTTLNTIEGKNNKIRNFTDSIEKIRQNVSKAIHLAFDKIKLEHPELQSKLSKSIRCESGLWRFYLNI